ncbi:uncharacterized protein LOC123640903 [Lemur catta]|uniref:uncharacterized protein LOC123640903 n=1 Tax=Lemur catta TaxID=9447 RepID=UPI001E26C71D|nr:uncharacterized protein LOC123640903 [Lemur catta]
MKPSTLSKATSHTPPDTYFKCSKEGHWANRCQQPHLPTTPCPACGQEGHWKSDCPWTNVRRVSPSISKPADGSFGSGCQRLKRPRLSDPNHPCQAQGNNQDLLTAEKGGTCIILQKECCYYVNDRPPPKFSCLSLLSHTLDLVSPPLPLISLLIASRLFATSSHPPLPNKSCPSSGNFSMPTQTNICLSCRKPTLISLTLVYSLVTQRNAATTSTNPAYFFNTACRNYPE